ncbi:hypothetical protein A6P39_016905 [Streptomyces sp. FXJ1.172]|nr:hypothetical protein [Streptomyces sp. FXJ1.172]WEO95566.1 hypothetical protein A6P39_016905 [Streptomyces sp. FXJ1.172]
MDRAPEGVDGEANVDLAAADADWRAYRENWVRRPGRTVTTASS